MSPSSPSPCTSDFRFTYLGPRGTFTPFHRDVYASYSWSANIVGRKAWWLFHPESMPAVRDLWQQSLARRRAAGEDVRDAGELPFDLRQEPDIAAVAMKLIQEVCTCEMGLTAGGRGNLRAEWMVSPSRQFRLCTSLTRSR